MMKRIAVSTHHRLHHDGDNHESLFGQVLPSNSEVSRCRPSGSCDQFAGESPDVAIICSLFSARGRICASERMRNAGLGSRRALPNGEKVFRRCAASEEEENGGGEAGTAACTRRRCSRAAVSCNNNMSNYRLATPNYTAGGFLQEEKKEGEGGEWRRGRQWSTAKPASISIGPHCPKAHLDRAGVSCDGRNATEQRVLLVSPRSRLLHVYLCKYRSPIVIITRGIVYAAPRTVWRWHTPRPYATRNSRHRRLIARW